MVEADVDSPVTAVTSAGGPGPHGGLDATRARVLAVEDRLDVSTLSERREAAALDLNDIGRVRIAVEQPVLLDPYGRNPATGAFILVDAATNQTAAAGMMRET